MLYRGNLELLESWCNKINLLTYLPARHNSTTIPQRYICTSNKIRSWLKVSSILISPVSEIAGTKWIHKKHMSASYTTMHSSANKRGKCKNYFKESWKVKQDN